jgi:FixJ family two-component response regulator
MNLKNLKEVISVYKNKIILIDDQEMLLDPLVDLLEELIASLDYKFLEVRSFTNPDKALDYVMNEHSSICLIISDENMPPSDLKGGEIFTHLVDQITYLPILALHTTEANYILNEYPKLIGKVMTLNKPVRLMLFKNIFEDLFKNIAFERSEKSENTLEVQCCG